MKIVKNAVQLAAAVLMLGLLALASTAPAMADHDTVGGDLSADGQTVYLTCETFGALYYTLGHHVFFASDDKSGRDRSGLVDKLDNAHLKLLHEDPPKPCDAAQKLDDFSFKVKSLRDANTADKMKISDDTDGTSIQCLVEGSAALAQSLRPAEGCDSSGGPGGGKGPKNR